SSIIISGPALIDHIIWSWSVQAVHLVNLPLKFFHQLRRSSMLVPVSPLVCIALLLLLLLKTCPKFIAGRIAVNKQKPFLVERFLSGIFRFRQGTKVIDLP